MEKKKIYALIGTTTIITSIVANLVGNQNEKLFNETGAHLLDNDRLNNEPRVETIINPAELRQNPTTIKFDDNQTMIVEETTEQTNNNAYSESKTESTSKNSSEYNEFIRIANNSKLEYKYSQYYNIDQALSRTGAVVTYNYGTLICETYTIPSHDLLKQTIIKNNNEFFINNHNPSYYSLNSNQLDTVVDIVLKSLEGNYNDLTEESIKRVYEQLSNLTVIGVDSTDTSISLSPFNALYNDNAVILIDFNMLQRYSNYDEALYKTILHEFAHAYQRKFGSNGNYTRIGTSQYFSDLIVNPLIWKFINESTAESNSMKESNSSHPMVYSRYYYYLQTLNLVALINPNYNEQAIELANINFNPDDIFEIYNAKTYQEKYEIAEMLYSIDIVESKRQDFYNYYNGNDSEETIKVNLLSSAMFTNSRYFYTNIAERIENGGATLEDVFYLIKVFETDLNSHLEYESNPSSYQEFISKYTELQNNFFQYICDKEGINFNDLVNTYIDYSKSTGYTTPPSLSWLSNTERQYIINEFNSDNSFITSKSLRSYDNTNKEISR